MTIYLDAIWTLNFLLDLMILILTQYIAKDDTRRFRIIFGAFIASLLVPITVYFPDTIFVSFIGKLFYSIIIILASFRVKTFTHFSKLFLIFYFTSFAIGGGLIAIHFLLNNSLTMTANGILSFHSGFGDPISWLFIIIGFPVIWYFTKNRMDKHIIEQIKYDQLYPVTIEISNIQFTTNGYVDSGNQLVDPLTNKPVVICDEPFLKQWFSECDWNKIKSAYEQLNFELLPAEWEDRIQVIPYYGVEGKSNILIAIRPDQLVIYDGTEKIVTNNILIGIQFATLTKDMRFHCLLQPKILQLIKSPA